MQPKHNWYVITGAPSSGKTILINMLARRGYNTVPEAARLIIDEGLAQGLTLDEIRGDEHAWQEKILRRILEHEAATDQAALTFFDRGAHDGLAHLHHYGLTPKDHWRPVIGNAPYRTVFLLDPLPSFDHDYARTENAEFSNKITDMMRDAYREAGVEPVRIPYTSPEERLKLILSHLQ